MSSEESYNVLNQVFDFCTKECEDLDVRNRGYMYCYLMTIDKPWINEDASGFNDNLLATLIIDLGTLVAIYKKPSESFMKKTKEKFLE